MCDGLLWTLMKERFDAIDQVLAELRKHMATQQDLDNVVSAIETENAQLTTAITDGLSALGAEITALEGQVASGTVSQASIDSLRQVATDMATDIQNVAAATAPPAPPAPTA